MTLDGQDERMIKDWLKDICFDGESILVQGTAAEVPAGKTLTLYKSDGVSVLQTFNLSEATRTARAFIGRTPA